MTRLFKVHAREEYLRATRKIQIYNSLRSEKQQFEPIDSVGGNVKMYVCGLTPYDSAHLGHMVPALAFDLIRNYLEYRNLKVSFVQNVTDIDDKIIDRVKKSGEDPRLLTAKVTEDFYRNLAKMHIRPPDTLVRVSETLTEIVQYISDLIEAGFAYATPAGNVYFDISKKPDYGKLSNQRLGDLLEGVRVASEKDKKSPLDFALWKRDEESSLSIDSPWGRGRPGWHIECSVMIEHTLKTPIDIHGGGLDLKFPHHENEIAQSEAHGNGEFVRYWMHVGLLTIDGTKMSKSLGNFLTIDDAFERFGIELIRFVFLVHHYRSGVNMAERVFMENLNGLWELYRTLEMARRACSGKITAPNPEFASVSELINSFEKAMDDDFNSPLAVVALRKSMSHIRQLLTQERTIEEEAELASLAGALCEFGKVLGLFHFEAGEILQQGIRFMAYLLKIEASTLTQIEALLEQRDVARREKNFTESDRIRDELKKTGLEYLDSKGPSAAADRFLNLRFLPAATHC